MNDTRNGKKLFQRRRMVGKREICRLPRKKAN